MRTEIIAAAFVSLCAIAAPGLARAADTTALVTFSKDVAPIFQRNCQVCHRPGTVAPMSLVTYDEARPWARSIRQRVAQREMPPWHIDKTQGIQHYKNDRSLSDADIATIVSWVDAGAPEGDRKDLPRPVQFHDDDEWTIGKPDLIVTSPTHMVAATAADWWGDYDVATGLTEDRYVRAIETKPSKDGRFVNHHATISVIQDADPFVAGGRPGAGEGGKVISNFSEYVVGKYESS